MAKVPILIFLQLFLVALVFHHRPTQAGIRGVLCPDDDNLQNVTCQEQCRYQHNSLYGKCGTQPGDYNCYCSIPLPGLSEKSHACMDPYDTRYDLLCRAGCACAFNAVTGVCNYENHACECYGQNPNPRSKLYCPFKSYKKFAAYMNSQNVPGFYYPPRGAPKNQNSGK